MNHHKCNYSVGLSANCTKHRNCPTADGAGKTMLPKARRCSGCCVLPNVQSPVACPPRALAAGLIACKTRLRRNSQQKPPATVTMVTTTRHDYSEQEPLPYLHSQRPSCYDRSSVSIFPNSVMAPREAQWRALKCHGNNITSVH